MLSTAIERHKKRKQQSESLFPNVDVQPLAYRPPVNKRCHRTNKPKRELPYQPSYLEDISKWPRCQRCRRQYAPKAPCRRNRNVLVERTLCSNCSVKLTPLREEHFNAADELHWCGPKALRLHRKDLIEHYDKSPQFRDHFHKWARTMIAQCVRCHDPNKLSKRNGKPTKLSTYIINALKNLINKEFPFIAVFGRGGDDDEAFSLIGEKDKSDAIDEQIDDSWGDRWFNKYSLPKTKESIPIVEQTTDGCSSWGRPGDDHDDSDALQFRGRGRRLGTSR